jgi:hypothetical protein
LGGLPPLSGPSFSREDRRGRNQGRGDRQARPARRPTFFAMESAKVTSFDQLLERLRRVEALHARTDVAGERVAAAQAAQAIRAMLARFEQHDPPIEYKFTMADSWARRLFTALLRRYGLTPYRYHGQRYTTVMARVSKSFVDNTLWPEFVELDKVLREYLSDVTNRVIQEAIFQDTSEASERARPAVIEDQRGRS